MRWYRAVPHFVIKVPIKTNRAGSGPPTYGWGAVMVQFSSVVAQFSCVHTVRDLQPGRPGSVLAHSVNVV